MLLVCKLLNIFVLLFTFILIVGHGFDKLFRDMMELDMEAIWVFSVLISSGLSAYILIFKDYNNDDSLLSLWTKAKKSELKKKIED